MEEYEPGSIRTYLMQMGDIPLLTRREELDTARRIERTRREVHARLTYEINYWDGRAWKLEQEEAAGKAVQLPSLQAHRSADDLRERLRVIWEEFGKR